MESLSLISAYFNVSLPAIWPGSNSDHQITRSRSLWLPLQFHTKLVGQLITLAVIAVVASAGRVRPHIFATPRLRENVVNRKVVLGKWLSLEQCARLYTAVDASVIIPHQHTLAAPMCLSARHINIRPQRDHRRNRKLVADCFEEVTGLLDDDRFACQQQINRARDGNDRQRLPIAPVEQQHPVLQSENVRHKTTSTKTLFAMGVAFALIFTQC